MRRTRAVGDADCGADVAWRGGLTRVGAAAAQQDDDEREKATDDEAAGDDDDDCTTARACVSERERSTAVVGSLMMVVVLLLDDELRALTSLASSIVGSSDSVDDVDDVDDVPLGTTVDDVVVSAASTALAGNARICSRAYMRRQSTLIASKTDK